MTIKNKRKKSEEIRRRSTNTVNAYISTKAFRTHSNKHKYYKCIYQNQNDNQKSTSTVMIITKALLSVCLFKVVSSAMTCIFSSFLTGMKMRDNVMISAEPGDGLSSVRHVENLNSLTHSYPPSHVQDA